MTSLRVGTDLVQVEHVQGSIDAFGDAYLRRVYTEGELRTCRDGHGAPAAERLAARFAAKEAAIKVLRPSVGVALTDIEVTIGRDGAPGLSLTGSAAKCGDDLDLVDCSLSLTHDGAYAAAVLVVVAGAALQPSTDEQPISAVEELKVNERTQVIRNVLTEHGRLAVPVAELSDDSSLYEAGLTSHAVVNVMLALENEFDTEFPVTLLRRSTFESIEVLNEALQSVLEVDA